MKTFKKTIALLLVAVMILPLGTFAYGEKTDSDNHWAKEEIQYLMGKGLVSGYDNGDFKPEQSITRAEFIKIINQVFGYSKVGQVNFKDVGKNDWFHDEIGKAIQAGYIGGYGDNTIKPNSPISRQEASKIMGMVFDLDENKSKSANEFIDGGQIGDWARGYVSILKDKGYISGYLDKTFKPTNLIKRAEAVKMISTACGNIINSPGEYKENVDGNVLVNTTKVVLKDMTIKGDLYLAEGIGEGDVTLDNLTVKGKTYIRGGGENSIIIRNAKLGEVVVKKENNNVRLVLDENTNLSNLLINEYTILVIKKGAKIESLKVIGKANIQLEKGAQVGKIEIQAKGVEIKSEGTIGSIVSNQDVKINDKIFEKGKEINLEDKTTKPTSSGGSSGGVTKVDVSAITVTGAEGATTVVNGKTLQMGVVVGPDDASNKKVTWSVIDGTGSATISSSGLLKGTKVGTVTVKAAAQDGSGKEDTKEITIHADLTAYNAALAAVPESTKDTYTLASWNVYQGVVTTNVVTVTNTQEEVTTATNNIIAAQADLVIPVTGISISGDGSVAKDDTLQLTAIITPDNASNKGVTWNIESGGTGSATINTDGLLNPTSEGTVIVKVVSQYDTSITATKKITVTASKLDAAKANAKSELDKYVKASDYTINATALSTAIADGKAAIDSATNETEVATALADAKAVIDTIKSDAQIVAEELATAKENAKTKLENYKVATNYTTNAAALSTAIAEGKTAIDNATDIAGVNTALANAKAVIDAIKSDKDLDDDDIATAKTNIEAATYTASQAEVSDASAALSKAQALVNALELKETTATVVAGTFAEATAGTEGSINGTDGSYTFTVTIAKGAGTEVTTAEQTMSITATPYDSTEQDNTDIATAKANIEAASYTATQAEASDSAKALTKAQALVEALELKGTTATVVVGTFVEAITGTEASVNGTDGSFSFTVKIIKGLGAEVTTTVQTMTITATSYDPTADNADIATAKANIESAAYTATQAEVSDASAAKTKVETIISGLDTAETIVDVVPGSFSGAVSGVDGVFAATDGSYTFTVKINKGGGTEAITKELSLTITAETTTVSKASKVTVNKDKTLDSSKPYLVNGEPAASGTLGSADCTAHFDSSTGVLTLQGYNGAEIRTLYESNPDLIIKLIGDNNVTTTSSQNGIYNGHYGNIYITSDSDATLNVTSTSDNDYVYAIATNDQGGKSIMIGGKAKVTVTAKTTAASKKTSVAHAGKDFIIQDSASFIGKSTATASGSYAVFTKEKIIINTTGNIDIDCYASSGSYAFNGMNGVDIKNVTLMTLKKATTGSFIAGSQNLSRVAVNIKDNIATYRGGTPYELKVLNGQITAVQEGQIGVPYQGLENDKITIKANTIDNFEFVKWTNGDGTDIDSSLFVSPTGVGSPEAKIKMPANHLNIKAGYKSTLFVTQPSFHRGEKKIKWSVGGATFSGSGDSFKLQKKTAGEWEVRSYPSINTEKAKNGYIDVNNNSSSHTLYTPDGTYRLYFEVAGKDHYSKEFVVEWEDTITIQEIPGVTPPVTGATPVTTITATDQYTGTVTWSPTATKFAGDTVYTATITLKAKSGFTLDGVAANYFTVEGATTTNTADSGVVTAAFPATAVDPITASISNVLATNGTVTITLDKKPTVAPIATDFTATSNINAAGANALALTGFNYDGDVTVTYTFTPVVKTDVVQKVVVAVTYNSVVTVAPTFEVVLAPDKEITGFTALTSIVLSSDEKIIDLAALKASGKLPTEVTVTDGTTPAQATITDWTGTFDGSLTGAKTLTAVWTMPAGYVDVVSPITVEIVVNVNVVQTPREVTGYSYIGNNFVRLTSNEKLVTLAELIASGKLPTEVTVTDGITPAQATITNWTGTYNGGLLQMNEITAVWTMPANYVDEINPITVKFYVHVDVRQIPFEGGTGSESDPYQIKTAEQLNYIRYFHGSNFIQMADIDLSAYLSESGAGWNDGAGWEPIGKWNDSTTGFAGSYNGNNKTITGLYINRPTSDYQGLFGRTRLSTNKTKLEKIRLIDVNISGKDYIGGLSGELAGSTTGNEKTIEKCYVSGSVSGSSNVGGLVGSNQSIIKNSNSNALVSGNSNVGGLVGINHKTIENCYAVGLVTGTGTYVGGLVGENRGVSATVTSSYYDSTTTEQSDEDKGVGKITADMKTQSTFTGWDFTNIWTIETGSYPTLR